MKVRTARPGRRDFLAALAKELGVSEAKIRDAFRTARPRLARPRGPRARFDDGALAKELGVTEAQLRAAFEKLHDAAKAEAKKRHDEFTAALAKELDLDVAKVRAALRDRAPFLGRGPDELRKRGGPGRGHGFRPGRP